MPVYVWPDHADLALVELRSARALTVIRIAAPDTTQKPYVLLARAMEEAGKVGIARFVMRNKQYVAALRAQNGSLLMSTMVYTDELRAFAAVEA